MKSKLLVTLTMLIWAATTAAAFAGQPVQEFDAVLQANQVGPKPAVTEAVGQVTFYFDQATGVLTYELQVTNIEDVRMAHLHVGPSDRQGPLVFWLYPGATRSDRKVSGTFSGILAKGEIRPENLRGGISFDELIKSMQAGQAYVNVHTAKYIPGELRGQVE